MGIAAYRRGNEVISRGVEQDHPRRPVEFEMMDRWNAVEKVENAGVPFEAPVVAYDVAGKVWWVLDPEKLWRGFGYWYGTIDELMRVWKIQIVGCDVRGGTRYWQTEIIN